MTKKITHILPLLLLLLIYGYQNYKTNNESIIGTWKVIHCEMNLKDLSPILLNQVKNDLLTTTHIFKSDSTYITTSDSEKRTGNWNLDSVSKELCFYDSINTGSKPEKYKYSFATSSKMFWMQNFGDLGSLKIILEQQN